MPDQKQPVKARSVTNRALCKVMVCTGLSGSCLINSINSIHPLEGQALTSVQLLKPGKKFTGRAAASMVANGEKIKAAKFHYATQTLAPSTAAASATQTRFDQTKPFQSVMSSSCKMPVPFIHHTGRHQRHSGNLCQWRSARHLPDKARLRTAAADDNVCANGHQ